MVRNEAENVVQFGEFAKPAKRPWEEETLEEAVDLVLGMEMRDSARIVYLSLLRRWWKSRGTDFYERVTSVQLTELAKSCSESEATVKKALKELEEGGFLKLSEDGRLAYALEVPVRTYRPQARDDHTCKRPMFAVMDRNEFLPKEERVSMKQMDEECADHINDIARDPKAIDMFKKVAKHHGIEVSFVVKGKDSV